MHGTIRLLLHDLHAASAFGMGVHVGALYDPGNGLRVGAQLTNALTTTLFWSTGTTESYLPEFLIAADYHFQAKRIPFGLHPVLQLELPVSSGEEGLNQGSYGMSGGLEISFQEQLYIHLGQNSLDQFQVGARIRTSYLDLYYGTGFSALTDVTGQTQRVGVMVQMDRLLQR